MLRIGKRLRSARENKDLTQVAVSKLTYIHNKTLSGYENDVAFPDLEKLHLLCELYEVSLDYIIGKDDPFKNNFISPYSKLDIKIISALENCTDEQKYIFLSILESWGIITD